MIWASDPSAGSAFAKQPDQAMMAVDVQFLTRSDTVTFIVKTTITVVEWNSMLRRNGYPPVKSISIKKPVDTRPRVM